jgi:hypothetical protein
MVRDRDREIEIPKAKVIFKTTEEFDKFLQKANKSISQKKADFRNSPDMLEDVLNFQHIF